MRKDMLAAGARKATFAGGEGEGDIFRNVSDEPRMEFVPEADAKPIAKKVFRPLGKELLVLQTPADEVSSVIITEGTIEKEKPAEGKVLAIGKDLTTIAVGDTVVFGKYSGQEYKLNGAIHLILNENEVKGILEDEQETQETEVVLEYDSATQTFGGCTNFNAIGRA